MNNTPLRLVSEGQPFGVRLSQARTAKKVTQQELANRLGVDEASVIAWESGTREPRTNRVVMLSGILGVSVNWLVDGSDDEILMHKDSHIKSQINELKDIILKAQESLQRLENDLV